MPSATATTTSWARNLYTKTGLPDNETPKECFLDAIQKNKNVRQYAFCECALAACQVSLQLCAVLVFVVSYLGLHDGLINAFHVSAFSAAVTAAGYLIATGLAPRLSDVEHAFIFLALGLGLSPVLYKLTDRISTDTILTTSSLMLFSHLLFHNYSRTVGGGGGGGGGGGDRSKYSSNPLSLNAALFASVCLASRLDSSQDCFALLTISVAAFVLFPVFRARIKGNWSVIMATACGSAFVVSALVYLSELFYATMSAVLIVFISLLAPYLFVRWQRHKDTIHGPWDEAVPNLGK